jgi:hypothetical protein
MSLPQRLAIRWRTLRPVLLKGALVLGIVFAFIEVGVRVLPPDAVHYDVQEYTNGELIFSRSGIVTDPATISQWRAAVTSIPSPTNETLISALIHAWRKDEMCAPLGSTVVSYVFVWHGFPTESVTSLPVCGPLCMISSGGIPDPRTFIVSVLPPIPS